MKQPNLFNEIFGRWNVIGPEVMTPGVTKWLCRCECGSERSVEGASLRRGLSTSCGCRQKELATKNVSGMRFGRLVVMDRVGSLRESATWNCLCDCGNSTIQTTKAMVSGNTRSCGCLFNEVRKSSGKANRTHGMSNTRIFSIWNAMRGRCSNANNDDYVNYGGRGIKVCERWDRFENFLHDMGEPEDGMTIDRKDVNGHYEPTNCRWASYTEQARNTRANRMISAFSQSMTLAQWSDETGLNSSTIANRIKRGWPIEKVLTTKPASNAGGKRSSLFTGDKFLVDVVSDVVG